MSPEAVRRQRFIGRAGLWTMFAAVLCVVILVSALILTTQLVLRSTRVAASTSGLYVTTNGYHLSFCRSEWPLNSSLALYAVRSLDKLAYRGL